MNDYLAQRDRDWMGKIFEFLGLSVGVILSTDSFDFEKKKKTAYACDITMVPIMNLGLIIFVTIWQQARKLLFKDRITMP